MVGTVTTHSHCLVDGKIAYTGSRACIVGQLCEFGFDEAGTLWYQKPYTEKVFPHSYSDEYTDHERQQDAVQELYSRFANSGQYDVYRNIGY